MMEKQPPKQIYLQAYDSDSYDDNTWCQDKINDEDIEYILQSEYDQLRAENERLRCVLQEIAEDNSYREDTDNEVGWHINNAYEVMNKLKLKSKQALNEVKE